MTCFEREKDAQNCTARVDRQGSYKQRIYRFGAHRATKNNNIDSHDWLYSVKRQREYKASRVFLFIAVT